MEVELVASSKVLDLRRDRVEDVCTSKVEVLVGCSEKVEEVCVPIATRLELTTMSDVDGEGKAEAE